MNGPQKPTSTTSASAGVVVSPSAATRPEGRPAAVTLGDLERAVARATADLKHSQAVVAIAEEKLVEKQADMLTAEEERGRARDHYWIDSDRLNDALEELHKARREAKSGATP